MHPFLLGWQHHQMVKWRAHIAFALIMFLYFLTRYLRSTTELLPDFVRFHLTDLLFVPAMSLFALIILRYTRRDRSVTIHWLSVMIQVVIVSLYFEWYLPNNSPKGHIHVGDSIDCLMYVLGGILFLILQPFLSNQGKKKRNP